MRKLLLVLLLAPVAPLRAQDVLPAVAPYPAYRASFGILANPKALGIQAETRFWQHFGARLTVAQSFDYRPRESGGAAIGLLTYYLPLRNPRIEPMVGIGTVYSLYRWNTGYDKGTLTDLNLGGGLGVNLRFHANFRTGISVLAANNFEAAYSEGTMRVVRRRLLVMPALTFDVLF
jgi:hypothetical protein